MVMPVLADLYELHATAKIIHNCLVTAGVPPLYRYVVLASGRHDPEGYFLARQLLHLGIPRFLPLREMNIAPVRRQLNRQAQPRIEEVDETMKTMIEDRIAVVDQRVRTVDLLYFRVVLRQGCQVWIMLPKLGIERSYIG